MVLFHGAGGVSTNAIDLLRPRADVHGLILLAPDSRGRTWDLLLDGFGTDVAAIDAALAQTFANYAVDPARIILGGFSDGASYALSLGLTNGDLVAGVVAFSPGFLAPATVRGSPHIYISHGIHDDVLPIDRCSRRIVPALEDAGYDVTYREFDGPHTVPPEIVDDALAWLDQLAVPVATQTP
jgi:predicted esterase